MPVFKLSKEIFNNQWTDGPNKNTAPPLTEQWHNDREITIEDVSVWEQIYHEPGNIGIYAAYRPFTEFYIIVFELFLKTKYGIFIFYNENLVCQEALKFGIRLDGEVF
jgi:hypothetical protein